MKKSVLCFAAGTAGMYFADPIRGRRRRAVLRDWLAAVWHDVAQELDKAERDIWNRAHGVAAGLTGGWQDSEPDGSVLVERVRSAIGRAVSHPHAIRTRAENGRIVLEGPILDYEVKYLLRRVRAVRGVREVVNLLDVHADPGGMSSLRGGVPRCHLSALAQHNWNPSLRMSAGALGGMLLVTGIRNRGPVRWMAAAGSGMLLARAVANQPIRQILGFDHNRGVVNFEKTIHIHAPIEDAYSFWADFENFPKFMTHLKEVRQLSEERSHWVAAGPGGISISWDAEITEQRTNEVLAWRSLPGSMVLTWGVVRFHTEAEGRTRVQIYLSYCPLGGIIGHVLARLFGADPKSEMDEDLVRLKSLLEIGKTRAHGVAVTREQMARSSSSHSE